MTRLALAAVLCLTPAVSAAHGLGNLFTVAFTAEFLIPDLRVELDERSRAWLTLAWPVVVYLGDVRLKDEDPAREPQSWERLGFSITLEPEWRPRSGDVRARMGARGALGPVFEHGYIVADAGAVFGTDGAGGYGGVGFGVWEWGSCAAVVVRRTWTTQGARFDLLLDVALPLQFLFF